MCRERPASDDRDRSTSRTIVLGDFVSRSNSFCDLSSDVYSNTFHSSVSEKREHLTARGFMGGRGNFTIHVDMDGSLLGFYRNAGRWADKDFNVHQRCEEI
jgi:hypothetical protein